VARAVAKIEEGVRALDNDDETVWLALRQLVEKKLGKCARPKSAPPLGPAKTLQKTEKNVTTER
jgi:hypothetical protein